MTLKKLKGEPGQEVGGALYADNRRIVIIRIPPPPKGRRVRSLAGSDGPLSTLSSKLSAPVFCREAFVFPAALYAPLPCRFRHPSASAAGPGDLSSSFGRARRARARPCCGHGLRTGRPGSRRVPDLRRCAVFRTTTKGV